MGGKSKDGKPAEGGEVAGGDAERSQKMAASQIDATQKAALLASQQRQAQALAEDAKRKLDAVKAEDRRRGEADLQARSNALEVEKLQMAQGNATAHTASDLELAQQQLLSDTQRFHSGG